MASIESVRAALTAPNAEAARGFYSSVFGWDVHEVPAVAGPGEFRFEDAGQVVAVARQAPQDALAAGLPASWVTPDDEPPTFRVRDIEASVDRALRHGAHVVQAGTIGSTMVDPQGAVFRLEPTG